MRARPPFSEDFYNNARTALKHVGVPESEGDNFIKWAATKESAAYDDAIQQMFYENRMSKLKGLMAQYRDGSHTGISGADLLGAELPDGMRAWRDGTSGDVLVQIPGHGVMKARVARRMGS